MRRWLLLYAASFTVRFKAMAQYRFDTWLGLGSNLAWRVFRLAFIGVIFSIVAELGDWSAWEVALMWGISYLGQDLSHLLFPFALSADYYFYYGGLDYAKVRPAPILLWASVELAQPEHLLTISFYAAVTILAMVNTGIIASPFAILLVLIALAASVLVRTGVTLITYCSVAWFSRARSVAHGMSALNEHTKYPLDVLPLPLQALMTIVPFAFTSFYPIAFALRPSDYWLPGAFSLPIGLITAALGFAILRLALRKYQSVGSVEA